MNNQIAVVVSYDNKNIDALQTIKAIKQAGFENVFVQWYDKDFSVSQQEVVKACQKEGLKIIFAHLGYQKINNIWLEDKEYDSFVERYKKNILDLHNLGIDTVVMHLSSKFLAPSPNDIGLKRFKEIADYAQNLGVKIAFENTKVLNHVSFVLENIKNENVGICFDAGHYHCNNKDNWDISEFNNRVFAVHLHDNDSSDDQHLLPFDGTNNWPKIIKKLDAVNYQGPITLEVVYHRDYVKMDVNDFYKEAYKRAIALRDIR